MLGVRTNLSVVVSGGGSAATGSGRSARSPAIPASVNPPRKLRRLICRACWIRMGTSFSGKATIGSQQRNPQLLQMCPHFWSCPVAKTHRVHFSPRCRCIRSSCRTNRSTSRQVRLHLGFVTKVTPEPSSASRSRPGQYDISDETQAQAIVERCIAEFGPLDVVVNHVVSPVSRQS